MLVLFQVIVQDTYMTSTTWTRNTDHSDNPHLTDEDFGSFRGGRSYFYSRRDAKGRFVKAVHVDHIKTDDLPMWNGGRTGHASESCAAACGTPERVAWADAKFFCSVCVFVPVFDPFSTAPTKRGEQRCARCDETKKVTRFPTVHDHGVVTRATVCRQCRDEQAVPRKVKAPWQ